MVYAVSAYRTHWACSETSSPPCSLSGHWFNNVALKCSLFNGESCTLTLLYWNQERGLVFCQVSDEARSTELALEHGSEWLWHFAVYVPTGKTFLSHFCLSSHLPHVVHSLPSILTRCLRIVITCVLCRSHIFLLIKIHQNPLSLWQQQQQQADVLLFVFASSFSHTHWCTVVSCIFVRVCVCRRGG